MNLQLPLSCSDTDMQEKHVTLKTANAKERENFANEYSVKINREQSDKENMVN